MNIGLKTRVGLGCLCVLAMTYYMYELNEHIKQWTSQADIRDLTECDSVFLLQSWVLTQSLVWCFSLMVFLMLIIEPESVKYFLCFLYTIGPLHLIWTLIASIILTHFISCCRAVRDECEDFYPFKHLVNISVLLGLSVLFSLIITAWLLYNVLGNRLVRLYRELAGYMDLD